MESALNDLAQRFRRFEPALMIAEDPMVLRIASQAT
jgi:hypothetical protein